jgi:hypothetical protein
MFNLFNSPASSSESFASWGLNARLEQMCCPDGELGWKTNRRGPKTALQQRMKSPGGSKRRTHKTPFVYAYSIVDIQILFVSAALKSAGCITTAVDHVD